MPGTTGINGEYDQPCIHAPSTASRSITAVMVRPHAMNPNTPGVEGETTHARLRKTSATAAYATKAITASPTAALLQTFTASQWGATAMPSKSGACQISQGRLRRNGMAKSQIPKAL